MQRTSTLHWFCKSCEKPALTAVKNEKLVEEKCSSLFTAFRAELEDKFAKQFDNVDKKLTDLQEQMEELKQNQKPTSFRDVMLEETNHAQNTKNRTEDIVKTVTSTLNEKMQRQNNIVIFGLTEVESNLKDDIRQKDGQTVTDIFKLVTGTDVTVGQDFETARLGKKGEVAKGDNVADNVAKRPLLVKFQDGKQKAAMMKNLNRLKGSHYNISIRHDQNREDRRVEKELWEEAKRKNQEEKDAQFVHVIRGEAWSRKVVRMRRRD
jgi:hypothetical protein